MPKICNKEGCTNNVFGKGYCSWHQYMRTDKKPLKKKKNKSFRNMSVKREGEYKIYRPLRDKYMKEHPICERCNNAPSNDLHHKAGKIGKMLYDILHFSALCRNCHNWVHDNPKEANEEGWLYKVR